jgi:hypothetical protein
MNEREFDALADAARSSMTGRIVSDGFLRLATAAKESTTAAVLASLTRSAAASHPDDRLRSGALVVAIAALLNILLLWRASQIALPGIPRSAVALIAVFALAIAVAPAPFRAAWPVSRMGRAWRGSMGRMRQNNDE